MVLVGSFESARSSRRAARLAVTFAVVALLVADLAGLYKVKARVRPVTVDQAVAHFRESSSAPAGGSTTIATTPAAAAADGGQGAVTASRSIGAGRPVAATSSRASATPSLAALPAPGVYVYATSGSEAVSALNTSHTYPDQTTMTVVATPCGRDVRWDALKERWDLWHTCSSGQAIALRSFTTYHSFLGQVNQRAYSCADPTYFRPESDAAGTTFGGNCSADDGSAAALRGKVLGYENQVVSGTTVQAVRVRIDETLTGSTHGTRWSDSWYRVTDGLLLKRISQTDADTKATFGDTHYTEHLSLVLASLDPRR
jgi:hypothetical protein